MRRSSMFLCFLFAALLISPTIASAQAVSGTLLGNITDSSGGAVPGATVTATGADTGNSRTTISNESGHYIFSSLVNGRYTVTAELQGFKKAVRQNVKVDVNTTIRVDMKLEVGALTEAVTVSAETPLLQTDRTDTGLLQVIIPAADALETVSVSTSNYDAEFGRAGGAVTNVTLKSGTNDLKGSAFVFAN